MDIDMADPRLKRLRPENELPPMYIKGLPEGMKPSWTFRVKPPPPHVVYSRPLVHHKRRNYLPSNYITQEGHPMEGSGLDSRFDEDLRMTGPDLPVWYSKHYGDHSVDTPQGLREMLTEFHKKHYYVLPEDTRSRPRRNTQETINMVKGSLLKTPKGRALLQQGRDIMHRAGKPDYVPTRREYERGENLVLLEEGYLNKRLVNPETHDARRRVKLSKAQRNLPREAWGTDMDIPEENWSEKMRKDRLEAGIGTQQFPELRVIDTK